MKTAVSIPDEVFKEVERLAKRLKVSRSRLFSMALSEFLARNASDAVTDAINKAIKEIGDEPDEFVQKAAEEILRNSEW